MNEYKSYPKTPRLFREAVITEKIDGTCSQVFICGIPNPDGLLPNSQWALTQVGELLIYAGSKNRWLTVGEDNYGFASWVKANAEELAKLGPGSHWGEWYGRGIQRNYGLSDRRFALFNTERWRNGATKVDRQTGDEVLLSPRPACCEVVPVLWHGVFNTLEIDFQARCLRRDGSAAVPGWMKPEGICIYHTVAGHSFKVLLENDERAKGE